MYFFDLEDYGTTNAANIQADIKANTGGGGINHCGRALRGSDWNDTATTAKETSNSFIKYVHDWFSASTISIGNSTNTLARNIYYNDYMPNLVEFQINRIKYFNQANSNSSKKTWLSSCVDGTVANIYDCPSYPTYNDFWASRVQDGSLYTGGFWFDGPFSGATNYTIMSANSATNIMAFHVITIVHPQFNDWNDSYYYNHNNSLRKVMGSLKRLMKAIDNDSFEEFYL